MMLLRLMLLLRFLQRIEKSSGLGRVQLERRLNYANRNLWPFVELQQIMIERVELIDSMELVNIDSGGKMNGICLMLSKTVFPYDFSRLFSKMFSQVNNEQSFVLIEDLDNRITFLCGPPSKLNHFGQGYDRGDYLKLAVVLLVDNALKHLSSFRSLEKVNKAA